MGERSMNRKEFLTSVGLCGVGGCSCILGGRAASLFAQESKAETPPQAKKPRSQERIEFAEKWVTRFFDVFDANLDPETRKKIMMANGRACFLQWIKETGQQIKPVTLERFAYWVKANVKDETYRIDGSRIYMQYTSAAETGQPSKEGACLCPLIESKPAGLSPTYCLCSVGYVKVMHEMRFGRPVEVELLDSVLKGGKRCKFKITLA
jgi:Family of unknown function (DUF6144)